MDSKPNYEVLTERYIWQCYLADADEARKTAQEAERRYQRFMLLATEHHLKMLKLMGEPMTPDVGGKDLM
jgi:hypothetical protein